MFCSSDFYLSQSCFYCAYVLLVRFFLGHSRAFNCVHVLLVRLLPATVMLLLCQFYSRQTSSCHSHAFIVSMFCSSDFYLPQSCFSSRGLVDVDDSATDESGDDEDRCSTSIMEEYGGQDCLRLPQATIPYQTSTPCKGENPSKSVLLFFKLFVIVCFDSRN